MTAREHTLVIEMFKQQMILYADLIECLKSREIVGPGDLEAVDQLLCDDEKRRCAIENHVEADYRRFAEILGVTGLPEREMH